MGILDRVLLGGTHTDPADRARREDVFVVARSRDSCGYIGTADDYRWEVDNLSAHG